MSIGIDELDQQHQAFFDLLMRLREAAEKGYGYACSAILAELAVQIRIHFTVEESLMRMLKFGELEAHHASHLELGQHVERFRQQAEDHDVSADVSRFIQRWLSEHVTTFDRRFASHIKNRLGA
jgi:hemerythrin